MAQCGEEAIANGTWRQCRSLNPYALLVGALCEMLQLVAAADHPVRIVHVVERGEGRVVVVDTDEGREKCDSTSETLEEKSRDASDGVEGSAEALVGLGK